jgi:protein-L-isoaspartate(D-aspartate) O-methyltransferase
VSDRVAEAFRALPREDFLRPADRHRAPYDGPLDIGGGQTSSQPRTVAAMLRLLDVTPGQRILDVGSGSGWTTALLAHLTGPTGSVLGVELEPDLVSASPRSLPSELVDQLGPTGVMVIPVGSTMLRVAHPGGVVTEHGSYRFVPLR